MVPSKKLETCSWLERFAGFTTVAGVMGSLVDHALDTYMGGEELGKCYVSNYRKIKSPLVDRIAHKLRRGVSSIMDLFQAYLET
jgi:hypothetical protein